MKEIEFNLIDEKWISVIDKDCNVTELSLSEVFRNAQNYSDLCGEIPPQDIAVMRILLAVLHTVIARYGDDGQRCDAETADDMIDRWKAIWDRGAFPSEAVNDYLDSVHGRFWLFHPIHPFMQEPLAKYGTKYAASKLNGELSESSNKSRLFSMLSGKDKNALTMAQAARWLLYVNAFDDTSAKPSSLSRKRKIKYGSPGAGWLGKLGLITLKGENLFETLMLNTALWTGYEETAAEQLPSWEKDRYIPKEDDVCIERTERVKTAQPDNLAALYTLRSRCILLERNEDGITGYSLLGGEFFDRENAFIEPMTVWRDSGNKKQDIYTPKRHDRSKQFWREFASVYPQTDAFHRRPGIISWFAFLKAEGFIPSRYMLNTKICSVQYGDKDFFITDVFSDSLSMSGDIILGMALPWQKCIEQAVELTEQIADIVGRLAREIFIAEGGDAESAPEIIKKAKSEYYFDIDSKFRKWLTEIDPSSEKPAEGKHAWEDIAVRTAKSLGRKIVNKAGTDAIIGRTVIVNDRPVRYSAAKAENNFYRKMGNIKQREV